jgi:hypothetical protein
VFGKFGILRVNILTVNAFSELDARLVFKVAGVNAATVLANKIVPIADFIFSN